MPGTYTQLLYHVIFSTKRREPFIVDNVAASLHQYLGGTVRNMRGTALCVGATADHVHMLIRWRTDETLAALMRTVKARSSKWLHEADPPLPRFAWQEGYGAFTVSRSQKDAVERYIAQQVEHHRRETFQEELIEFFRAHDIEYDERYIWD